MRDSDYSNQVVEVYRGDVSWFGVRMLLRAHHHLRVPASITALVLAAGMTLGACGDDGGGGTDAAATEVPAAADAGAAAGAGDKPWADDGDLGPIATGLRVALQAERVEVDDNTIHIYVKESDNIVAGAGSECIVASRVVPEGTTVVIHRDGGETTC